MNTMCYKPWQAASLLISVQLFLERSFSSHFPVVFFSGSRSPIWHSNFYSKNKIIGKLVNSNTIQSAIMKIIVSESIFKELKVVLKYNLVTCSNVLNLLACYSLLVTNCHTCSSVWSVVSKKWLLPGYHIMLFFLKFIYFEREWFDNLLCKMDKTCTRLFK